MLKAFVRDGVVYAILRVVTAGAGLLLLPLYTRELPPAEFGVIEAMTIAGAVLTAVVTLEIAQGLARHYSIGSSDVERVQYSSTAFWFTCAASVIAVVALWPLAPFLAGRWFGSPAHAHALRIGLLAIAGQALLYSAQTAIRYAGRVWSYAAVTAAFTATLLVAAFVCIGRLGWGLTGVFAAQSIASAAGVAVSVILARGDIGFVFAPEKCRQMLRFSMPLVLSSLGVVAAAYADRLAVGAFLSLESLGVYGVGARVASVIGMVGAAFQMALSPLIYQHYRDPGAPADIERLFRWFIAACSAPLLLAGAFAPEIVGIAATRAYGAAANVIFLLGVSALVSNLYLFAPGLWIANRTALIAAINVGVAAAGVACNALVIRWYGVEGAAAVTAAVATAGFCVQLLLAQRSYRIPFRWTQIAAAAAILTGFAIVGWTLPMNGFPPLTRALIALASAAAVAAILVPFGETREALRSLAVRRAVPPS